jgi:hypothetical protein
MGAHLYHYAAAVPTAVERSRASLTAVEQILPGVHHWTAYHERIRQDVHSYLLAEPAALLDPMLPAEGLDWFEGERRPERILLTNRHHYRHSGRFVDAFGCRVLCHEAGLHEFEGGPAVEGFAFGDEVAPGVVAREVGVICPEETALHMAAAGVMAFADALVRGSGGELSFVSDFLLGDDPEGVKRGLRESFRRLLELDFDSLLMAHGEPVVGGGRDALREFTAV